MLQSFSEKASKLYVFLPFSCLYPKQNPSNEIRIYQQSLSKIHCKEVDILSSAHQDKSSKKGIYLFRVRIQCLNIKLGDFVVTEFIYKYIRAIIDFLLAQLLYICFQDPLKCIYVNYSPILVFKVSNIIVKNSKCFNKSE